MVLTNVCWLGLLRDCPRGFHQSYALSIARITGVIKAFLSKFYILSNGIFGGIFVLHFVVLKVTNGVF